MFLDKAQPPMAGTALLTTTYTPTDAAMIQEILSNNGIPTIKQAVHPLDILPVLTGGSVFGEEIYVPAEALEEATALLDAFVNGRGEQAPE